MVLTAPSPATSGTSLVLRSGEGTTMPAVPFYATATPPGQLTTLGTSEKVLVTAVTGDTLTIVRAQGGTTAKSIAANWIFANAMYTDDVFQSSIVTDELMTGTVNGSNTVFTTTSAFSNIQVYKNGVAMHKTDDFTITGTNQITMVTAPATGTKLTATYIVGTSVMINGSNSTINGETPTGTVNGSNAVFTTLRPYIPGSLSVHINGIRQKLTSHFVETTPTTGVFTMGDAPLTGDDIMVSYQYVQSVSGNADTVDGYHANPTATAGSIFPLVAKTTDANNWTVYDYGLWKEYLRSDTKSAVPMTAGGLGVEYTYALPVGVALANINNIVASVQSEYDAQQLIVGCNVRSGSVVVGVKNSYSGTINLNGKVHIRIVV